MMMMMSMMIFHFLFPLSWLDLILSLSRIPFLRFYFSFWTMECAVLLMLVFLFRFTGRGCHVRGFFAEFVCSIV